MGMNKISFDPNDGDDRSARWMPDWWEVIDPKLEYKFIQEYRGQGYPVVARIWRELYGPQGGSVYNAAMVLGLWLMVKLPVSCPVSRRLNTD